MLDFVEKLKSQIRSLRGHAQEHLLSGRIKDMEQYKLLVGRLEGYSFVEEEINALLNKKDGENDD